MARRIGEFEAVRQQGLPSAGKADEGGIERTSPAVYAAAGLAFAADLIHLWATPAHLEQWWAYGTFFIATAAGQGAFGVALLRRAAQPLILAGIWANAAIIVLYVVTRTVGLPLGPHVGAVEDAGVLDMLATVAEVGVVVALVALLGRAYRGWTINALLLLGALLWMLRLTGALVGP